MTKTLHPMWPADAVEGVANVLGGTDWPGLSGPVIARRLAVAGVPDINPKANKRTRLWTALIAKQQTDQASNCIIAFITHAMALGNHLDDHNRFTALQDALAEPLALVGLRVNDQGKLARGAAAATLEEIAKLAGRLRGELSRRGVHAEVLRYCEEELIRKSIFHAVFEATKGLAERLRQLTGSTLDGADLIDYCFSAKVPPPRVRINSFRTETDRSEHSGFANLLRGVFGTFRNPPAHTPRATAGWSIPEPDALDLFSMLSFMHRRLDNASVTPRP